MAKPLNLRNEIIDQMLRSRGLAPHDPNVWYKYTTLAEKEQTVIDEEDEHICPHCGQRMNNG